MHSRLLRCQRPSRLLAGGSARALVRRPRAAPRSQCRGPAPRQRPSRAGVAPDFVARRLASSLRQTCTILRDHEGRLQPVRPWRDVRQRRCRIPCPGVYRLLRDQSYGKASIDNSLAVSGCPEKSAPYACRNETVSWWSAVGSSRVSAHLTKSSSYQVKISLT